MADDDKPDHIKKLDDLSEKVQRIIDTTNLKHGKAYISAAEEHLMNDDDEVDYKKLDDKKVQDSFADHMADTYIKAAREHFGADKEGNQLDDDRLMQAYVKVTRGELKNLVRKQGKEFTQEYFHEKAKPEFMKEVSNQLSKSARSHLDSEHIDDLIEHAHPDAKKYFNTKFLQVNDAADIYQTLQKTKSISKPFLENFKNTPLLTDDAKKDYDLETKD